MRRINVRFLLISLGSCAALGLGIFLLHGWQLRRNAGVYLQHGDRAFAKGMLDHALTHFSHYLTYHPEDVDALVKHGLTMDKQATLNGDHLGAVLALERVLRHDREQHELRFRLIQLLIRLARFREAYDHLGKLAPFWPKPAELEHMKGWCLEAGAKEREDYEKAAATFARAVTMDAAYLDSYVLWADILEEKLKNTEEAAEVMDKMVQANQQNYRARLIRSRFRQKHKQQQEADQDLADALRLGPKEAEVLFAAADAAQGRGESAKALGLLQQGLDLYPRRPEFIKARANVALRAHDRTEAVKILQRGLKDNPEAWDLHILVIDLLIDEKKLPEATERLAELRRAGLLPALPNYLNARLQIERGNWSEAITLLEQVRTELGTKSDWSSRVNALLGYCYDQIGDGDQQVASYRRAVQQEPGWTAAHYGLAGALLATGRIEDALTELKDLQHDAEPPPGVWALLGRAHLLRNLRLPEKERDWTLVETNLAKAEKATPKAVEVPLLKAEFRAACKEWEQAQAVLEQAKTQAPREVAFWCALADLTVRRGDYAPALRLLEQAEKDLGDRLEIRLARCRLWGQRGDNDAKRALVQLGQNLDTWTLPARTRLLRELAETWQRLGETTSAITIWRQLAQLQPHDLRSRFLLLEQASAAGQGAHARELLADLRKLEPEPGALWRYGAALLLVNEARGQREKLEEARKALAELARRRPDWPRVPLLEARIHELEGNYDQALNKYRAALEMGEFHPAVVRRAMQLSSERRRFEEAEQVLQKIEERMPLPRDLARLGAEAARGNGNPARALQLAALAAAPDSSDYRDLLWLGRLHLWAGQPASAEKILRRALDLAGHAPDTWIALAELLTQTKQPAAAEALLVALSQKLPGDRSLFTRARCQEAMGQYEAAEATYRQALAASPDDFVTLAAAADCLRRAEQSPKAEHLWRKLLDPSLGAPSEVVAKTRRALAVHLAGSGPKTHLDEALALLAENTHLYGETLADQRARAIVRGTIRDQRRQAIRDFEATLKRQPGQPDELFWFAQLLDAADDDFERIRELYHDALPPGQEAPHILASYIRTLLAHGETQEAGTRLERLECLEPNSARTQALREAVKKATN